MKLIAALCVILTIHFNTYNCIELKLIKSIDEFDQHVSVSRSILSISEDFIEKLFTNISKDLSSKSHARSLFEKNSEQTVLTPGGSKRAKQIHDLSSIGLKAARAIANAQGYQGQAKSNIMLKSYKAPSKFCPYATKPYCDFSYPYRSADGSCNNKYYTWWGMSETPFKRILNPIYDDGLNMPRRRSAMGRTLPNPRKIALVIHHELDMISHVTNMFPHFGQFIDHDLTLTALISDEEGTPIKCFCHSQDFDCYNIPIPIDDHINRDQRCMVTPRSAASFKKFNCQLGHREQLNLLTHWLDLSQTYGNDLKSNLKLRLRYGGLLNSSVIRGLNRDYLPFIQDGSCPNIPAGQPCFQSGDIRVNQNSLLTSIQTIWLREHNRVAIILAKINPYWSDEKLFQEARKIVTATYQHIIYKEWLPILVGIKVAKLYGLLPLNQGYFNRYNYKLFPNIANEFSTAAMRFGHTLVRASAIKVDKNYRAYSNSSFPSIIFKPASAFQRGGLDSYVRGCIVEPALRYDSNVVDHLNNHLFEGLNKDSPTKRFSLPALNIHRGRDHGLPGYNHYRALCGLNYAKSIDDLFNIPVHIRAKLKTLYEHVNDIDLFTGSVSELPIEGGVVGPTFACKFVLN